MTKALSPHPDIQRTIQHVSINTLTLIRNCHSLRLRRIRLIQKEYLLLKLGSSLPDRSTRLQQETRYFKCEAARYRENLQNPDGRYKRVIFTLKHQSLKKFMIFGKRHLTTALDISQMTFGLMIRCT